jgi:hypothetical protein
MSNTRNVDDAPRSTHAHRALGAPPPVAERRHRATVARYAIAVLVVVGLVAVGYLAWRTYSGDGLPPPQAGRPPVAVAVATAAAEVWQTQVSAVGTLVAVQGV